MNFARSLALTLFLPAFTTLACALPTPSPPPSPQPATASPAPLPTATRPAPTTPASPVPATPPVPATATADPNLPAWTLLLYMAADNNLEEQAVADLAELEAAGSSAQVNVLVQIDRPGGSQRLRLGQPEAAQPAALEPLQQLGPQNSGDPDTLTDYVAWAVQSYPANHYALILWGHGLGWQGIAFDEGAGNDGLSLPDLSGALDRALRQAGLSRLDVVGFDASLMGQLDVYATLQEQAIMAVASEGLVPGQGWPYQAWLQALYAQPEMDAAALARQVVSAYASFYQDQAEGGYAGLAAVRLEAIPRLVQAVAGLAEQLAAAPELVAPALGEARAGAATLARVYPQQRESLAAVDLGRFAGILAQRAPDPALAAAARQLGAAVGQAGGVAVFFPAVPGTLTHDYLSQAAVPAWTALLEHYYAATQASAPPTINISALLRQQVSLVQPGYVAFELAGRGISDVILLGGRTQADGRRRLLLYDLVVPEATVLADGTPLFPWNDGVHEEFLVWDTKLSTISDGESAEFAVLWPAEAGGSLYVVQGRYQPAGEESAFDANLVFDSETQEMVAVWSFQQPHGGAPRPLSPQAGDVFQLTDFYLNEADEVVAEPGSQLVLPADGKLRLAWQPGPSGAYFLGFKAVNRAGLAAVAWQTLAVNNEALPPDTATYLDANQGFQFDYPADWYQPVYQDALLYSRNHAGNAGLNLTFYPDRLPEDTAALKAQTLSQFGAVAVLYEEDVVIGGVAGLLTAYGYQASDGPHSGVFLAFVHEGTGYVVDLDGHKADEEATLAFVRRLIDSWAFEEVGPGGPEGQWSRLESERFFAPRPVSFRYQTLENGWQRFQAPDGRAFVALRVDAAAGDSAATVAQWLDVAGTGVDQFAADPPFRLALGGRAWLRANFRYQNAGGEPVYGLLMVARQGGQDVVAWAEAAAAQFKEMEESAFLPVIAGTSVQP